MENCVPLTLILPSIWIENKDGFTFCLLISNNLSGTYSIMRHPGAAYQGFGMTHKLSKVCKGFA